MFPCRRCGRASVPVGIFFRGDFSDTYQCLASDCGAQHFLSVKFGPDSTYVRYERWTRRYPPEDYDDGDDPDLGEVRFQTASRTYTPSETPCDAYPGPIVVCRRKRNFNKSELLTIWRASCRRCYLCHKPWRLKDRGRNGWHVDHVIPHSGGGPNTEAVTNMRVACAKCNLVKGVGFSNEQLRSAIVTLVSRCRGYQSRV